ncbi:Ceramidase [Monaibacterium marinum]|uniref:Ceramidase n=1 Tax=Pontivivens marinum TaxID=1690039 RepID=A0A2C9CQ22_9RHOB|nr:ceramidase domain-containing protein [Monaibacterium marinum]SOH92449.1 Ceramidase [Monaibacterium marinum]
MDWTAQVDNYCERTDFSFWAEPVNAASNAAFLIAAFVVWRIVRDRPDWGVRALLLILTAIGIGSFLFHTVASRWASTADVVPIMVFILVYLWLATVRMLELPRWAGFVAVALFFPFTAAVSSAVVAITGGLNGSEGYVPTMLLIAGYGLWLLPRKPATGRGLLIGAGLLTLSLTARSVDEALCEVVPLGTHWLWHLLNGTMLAWMILVLDRHGTTEG